MPYLCRKCGKECLWLKHKETLKPAPIEAVPNVGGNILVCGSLYRIATPEEIEKAKHIGKPLFLNHFASCEFAKSFRKPDAPKQPARFPNYKIRKIYDSTSCKCTAKKWANTLFCEGCYEDLSELTKQALKQKWGEGREDAYRAALDELETGEPAYR